MVSYFLIIITIILVGIGLWSLVFINNSPIEFKKINNSQSGDLEKEEINYTQFPQEITLQARALREERLNNGN